MIDIVVLENGKRVLAPYTELLEAKTRCPT